MRVTPFSLLLLSASIYGALGMDPSETPQEDTYSRATKGDRIVGTFRDSDHHKDNLGNLIPTPAGEEPRGLSGSNSAKLAAKQAIERFSKSLPDDAKITDRKTKKKTREFINNTNIRTIPVSAITANPNLDVISNGGEGDNPPGHEIITVKTTMTPDQYVQQVENLPFGPAVPVTSLAQMPAHLTLQPQGQAGPSNSGDQATSTLPGGAPSATPSAESSGLCKRNDILCKMRSVSTSASNAKASKQKSQQAATKNKAVAPNTKSSARNKSTAPKSRKAKMAVSKQSSKSAVKKQVGKKVSKQVSKKVSKKVSPAKGKKTAGKTQPKKSSKRVASTAKKPVAQKSRVSTTKTATKKVAGKPAPKASLPSKKITPPKQNKMVTKASGSAATKTTAKKAAPATATTAIPAKSKKHRRRDLAINRVELVARAIEEREFLELDELD